MSINYRIWCSKNTAFPETWKNGGLTVFFAVYIYIEIEIHRYLYISCKACKELLYINIYCTYTYPWYHNYTHGAWPLRLRNSRQTRQFLPGGPRGCFSFWKTRHAYYYVCDMFDYWSTYCLIIYIYTPYLTSIHIYSHRF